MSTVWATVSTIVHLPRMFPPTDFLFEKTDWICWYVGASIRCAPDFSASWRCVLQAFNNPASIAPFTTCTHYRPRIRVVYTTDRRLYRQNIPYHGKIWQSKSKTAAEGVGQKKRASNREKEDPYKAVSNWLSGCLAFVSGKNRVSYFRRFQTVKIMSNRCTFLEWHCVSL